MSRNGQALPSVNHYDPNHLSSNHEHLHLITTVITTTIRAPATVHSPFDLVLYLSRFMGSRSRPHRVLSVCVCVCVSRCLWVCVIEANSLQLRVITIGLYQFLSRSPSCQILAVCGRRLRGVSGSWFPRFLSPAAFLDSDRRRLVCPLLPCATRLSPYGKLRFCLRKAPFLPTESSASAYGKLRVCLRKLRPSAYGKLRLVSRCVLLLVINSLFPQLNPPVFIVTEGSDQSSWIQRRLVVCRNC